MRRVKGAKRALLNMLKEDAKESRITPLQHQEAYDILIDAEEGRELLFYINLIGGTK